MSPTADGDTERTAPKVSIVVPAYNRERFLSRTLDSVLGQTVTDWELVVSDDGSADGTAEVAHHYAQIDPRIRVVSAPNGGVARARNRGFAATDRRSEYVIFLDSDDRWFPDTLEAMIGTLEARPDWVSVYGRARCIDTDDQLIPGDDLEERMRERVEYRGWDLVEVGPDEPTTFAAMMFHNYTATPGLHLVRREVVERVGPFDPATDPADDWDMAIRISRLGPIGFLDRLVLEWRRHDQTLTGTSVRWRVAHERVRAKTLTSTDNSSEDFRLARIGYLSPSRSSLDQSWSDLRSGHLRAALRNLVRAANVVLHYVAVTMRRQVGLRRPGTAVSTSTPSQGREVVGR